MSLNSKLSQPIVDDEKKGGAAINVETASDEENIGDGSGKPKGVDVAYELAKTTKGMVLTPEMNKRLRRKADLYVMPFMCVMYCFQFLDRQATSYGAIMGLQDLGPMTGQMYPWVSTSLFIAYLCWSFPGSYSLQKLPLVKAVSGYIFLWGLTTTLQAAVFSYPALITARVFLGIFESPLLPGLALISNNFYHKSEVFTVTATFFSFCGLSNILGSCISYGIQKNAASIPMDPWRVLFLALGLVTMAAAILMVFVVPDNPTKAWWLTEEEKLLFIERIRDNKQGFGSRDFKKYQVYEALKDPRTYIYPLLAMAIEIPNSGISSFASILLNSQFGFDVEKALLMKAPLGAVQLVGLTGLGLLSRYKLIKHPLLISAGGICIAMLGGLMLAFAKEKYARLAGFYLVGFSPCGMITAITCLSANCSGRTKKVVSNAIYVIGFCFASCVGPQTFRAKEAPGYHTAIICIVVFYIFGLCLVAGLVMYNIYENRQRDKAREALGDNYVKVENSEFLDLTDRENQDFRYIW